MSVLAPEPPAASAGDAPAGNAPLSPREGYRRWAPLYQGDTPVTALDEHLVAALTPPLAGRRLLDAGCGTGRRLQAVRGAALAVGTDLSWEMLAAASIPGAAPAPFAAADVRALPFPPAAFDVVWCRLVMGHLPSPEPAYAELGRVCAPGGTVIVTDFHPDAARAGHTRSFRDADGVVRTIEHHVHLPGDHARAAAAAGLEPVALRHGEIGGEVRPFYARAGRLEQYAADAGLRLVLALTFRRAG